MAPAVNDTSRLALEVHRILAAELLETLTDWGWEGVRASHAAVFTTIDRRSGSRLTELARRAHITKQGMMLLVDELQERGYVRRVPDPEDARAKIVRLTARGRRYATDVRRAVAAIESRMRRDLGHRGYAAMREGLEALVDNDEGDSRGT